MAFVLNLPKDHPILSFEAVETKEDFLVYAALKDICLDGIHVTKFMGEHSVITVLPKMLAMLDDEVFEESKKRCPTLIINHFIDIVNRESISARENFILYDAKGMYWERIPVFLALFVKKFPMIKVSCSVNTDQVAIKIAPSDAKVTDFAGYHQPRIRAVRIDIPKQDILDMAAKVTDDFDSSKANALVKSYIFSMFGNWFYNPPADVPADSGVQRLDLRRLMQNERHGQAKGPGAVTIPLRSQGNP
jgi:hypothetical protein